MIIPVVILIIGLLLLFLQRKLIYKIEKLDSEYLGDFTPDNDSKALYQFK